MILNGIQAHKSAANGSLTNGSANRIELINEHYAFALIFCFSFLISIVNSAIFENNVRNRVQINYNNVN